MRKFAKTVPHYWITMLTVLSCILQTNAQAKKVAPEQPVPKIAHALCSAIQTGDAAHIRDYTATVDDFVPYPDFHDIFDYPAPPPGDPSAEKWVSGVQQWLSEDIKTSRSVLKQAGLNIGALSVKHTWIASVYSTSADQMNVGPYAKVDKRMTGPQKTILRIPKDLSGTPTPAINPKTGEAHMESVDSRLVVELTDGEKTASVIWVVRRTPAGPKFTAGRMSKNRDIRGATAGLAIDELKNIRRHIVPFFRNPDWKSVYKAAQCMIDNDVSLGAFALIANTQRVAEWKTLVPKTIIRFPMHQKELSRVLITYGENQVSADRVATDSLRYESKIGSSSFQFSLRVEFALPADISFTQVLERKTLPTTVSFVLTEDDRKALQSKHAEGTPPVGEVVISTTENFLTRDKKDHSIFRCPEHRVFRTYRLSKGPLGLRREAIPPASGGIAIHFIDGKLSHIEAGKKRFDQATPRAKKDAGRTKQKESQNNIKTKK
jgi:hypothetical protein